MMDHIIPISEARGKLPSLIQQFCRVGKHLIITKNGHAEAIMMSPEEYETLEVMADKELLRSIQKAHAELAKNTSLYSHQNVFKDV